MWVVLCVVWGVAAAMSPVGTDDPVNGGAVVGSGLCSPETVAGLSRTVWGPGTTQLVSSSPFSVTYPEGNVGTFTKLRLRVASTVAAPVGGCGALVGTRPGGSLVPVGIALDVDVPAAVYTSTTGGWIPTQVITVRPAVQNAQDPDAAQDPIGLLLGMVTDPDIRQQLETWTINAANNPDLQPPLEIAFPGDGVWGVANSTGVVSTSAFLDVISNSSTALQRRALQSIDMFDLVSTRLLIESAVRIGAVKKRLRRYRNRLDSLTEVANERQLSLALLDQAMARTLQGSATNSGTMKSIGRLLDDVEEGVAQLPQQVVELELSTEYLASNASALAVLHTQQFAALETLRNNVFTNLTARVQALTADLGDAVVALGQYAAALNAKAWSTLASVADPLDDAVAILRLHLAAAQDVLRAAGDELDAAADPSPVRQELGSALTSCLNALQAVAPQFVPLLGANAPAAAADPPQMWAAGSPLRAVHVDTLLHVQAGAVDGTARLLQTNITVTCDPLALRFLGSTQLTAAAVEGLWASEASGPCIVPVGFRDGVPPPGVATQVGNASDGAPPRFCVCWAVVIRSVCDAATAQDGLVVPAVVDGLPHPRTLSVAGLVGWNDTVSMATTASAVRWATRSAALRTDLQAPGGWTGNLSDPLQGLQAASACRGPVQSVTPVPWLVTHKAQLGALLGSLNCDPDLQPEVVGPDWVRVPVLAGAAVAGSEDGGPPGVGVTSGGLDVMAVAGSVTASVATGAAPLLQAVPLGNSRALWNASSGGVVPNAPWTLTAPNARWPARGAPLCATLPEEALRLAQTGIWITPAGLFYDAVGKALVRTRVLFRAAGYAAAGRPPPGVSVIKTTETGADGVDKPVHTVAMALVAGPWQAVGVAELQNFTARAQLAVAPEMSGGLPFTASTDWVDVDAPLSAPAILGARYTWACNPVCATGPLGQWALPECELPPEWGPPGPYVCDVPPGDVVLAGNPALRRGSLTYIAFMGADKPAELTSSGASSSWFAAPGVTTEEWGARGEDAEAWDPTVVGPGVARFARRLVSAGAAGVTSRPLGVCDYVCEQHRSPEARAAAAAGPPEPGSLCFAMLHNARYCAGPEGPALEWQGGPLGVADSPNRVVWVPRAWKAEVYGLVSPLGTVFLAVTESCPTVDAALVNATGYPVLGFSNGGGADLAAGAWAYTFIPVNASDPMGWAPGVSPDVVAATCVSTGRVPGVALAAGDVTTVPWLSTCADWEVRVFLGDSTEPCWTPTRFRLRFGDSDNNGSSSSSSGSAAASPARLPLVFTVAPVNTTTRRANSAAAAEARALAYEQVQAYRQRVHLQNEAAKVVMHGLGIDGVFEDALRAVGEEAAGGWDTLQASLTASTAVLAAGSNSSQRFVAAINTVGSEALAEAAALLNTTANFESIIAAVNVSVQANLAKSDVAIAALNATVEEVRAVLRSVNISEARAAFEDANDTATFLVQETALDVEEARLRVDNAKRKHDKHVLSPLDVEMLILAFAVCTVIELVRTRCCAVWRPLCWRRSPRTKRATAGPTYAAVDPFPGLKVVSESK